MTDIIKLLPDAIANQIAAGEVVQRPASLVKELMENAVDAGAHNIEVIIKDAGKALVQVIDDGKGMSHTDARLSLERHATSKIRTAQDLFTIRTMGFRGEALASIAAVAQMELKTKQPEEDLGTLIEIAGSKVSKQEPVAAQDGTAISVKNLFYNIPARRNFLKSNGVEMRHIVEEFQRLSLANSGVSFSLFQNDLKTYELPVSKLSQRIINLFGNNYQEQLVACSEETDHINVSGYVGKPEYAKRTRGEQFFYVNNRFIKSGYLHHAVLNAFEGLLQPDTHPFYVLFIEIDPKHIDVNVHPTKTEIKFDDERTVYGIIRAAVRQSLGTFNVVHALDFGQDVNFGSAKSIQIDSGAGADRAYSQFKNVHPAPDVSGLEKLFDRPKDQERSTFQGVPSEDNSGKLTFQSALNSDQLDTELDKKVTFQLHRQFIVSQVKSGMLLIDQQAAHERILFEQFDGHLNVSASNSQQSLFPVTLELNPADYSLVMEMQEEIKALGFQIEDFGTNCIVINGTPADLNTVNEKNLFEGLLEQFKINKQDLSLSRKENLARALAKRTAVQSGIELSLAEMKTIIDKLFACNNPNYAPDGRLTYFILDLKQINNFFN
jgi:DNA mismatch repair protein MutL